LGESVALAQQRRLDAVSKLWGALLNVRNNFPKIFTYLDVLLAAEYETFDHKKLEGLSRFSLESLGDMSGDKSEPIEILRPFVGEYLWYLFYVYLALHLRIAVIYANNRAAGKFVPWYHDGPTVKMLASVLTENELASFRNLSHGQINSVRLLIESKFLGAGDKIISGEKTGDFAAEQATRIARAAIELTSKSALSINELKH
jgi:hypothetical protein